MAIIAMTTNSSIKVKAAQNADLVRWAKFVPDSILLGNRVMIPKSIPDRRNLGKGSVRPYTVFVAETPRPHDQKAPGRKEQIARRVLIKKKARRLG